MNYRHTVKRPSRWISDEENEANIAKANNLSPHEMNELDAAIMECEMEAKLAERFNKPHRRFWRYLKSKFNVHNR